MALRAPTTRTACIFSGSRRRAGLRRQCGGHLKGPDARTPCDLLFSHAPYHLVPAGTMSPGTSGRSTPICTFLSSVSRARFACCPRACCGTPWTVPEQCGCAALHFQPPTRVWKGCPPACAVRAACRGVVVDAMLCPAVPAPSLQWSPPTS